MLSSFVRRGGLRARLLRRLASAAHQDYSSRLPCPLRTGLGDAQARIPRTLLQTQEGDDEEKPTVYMDANKGTWSARPKGYSGFVDVLGGRGGWASGGWSEEYADGHLWLAREYIGAVLYHDPRSDDESTDHDADDDAPVPLNTWHHAQLSTGKQTNTAGMTVEDVGYFQAGGTVISVDPIPFNSMENAKDYFGHLFDLCRRARVGWITPVEIFQPFYGRAVGEWVRQQVRLRYAAQVVREQHGNDVMETQPDAAFQVDLSGVTDAQAVKAVLGAEHGDRHILLVEIGAGRGLCARDVLVYLREKHPDLYERVQYHIVDVSESMVESQWDLLYDFGVQYRRIGAGRPPFPCENHAFAEHKSPEWSDLTSKVVLHHGDINKWDLPPTSDQVPVHIIGNEILDNMPHDKLVYLRKGQIDDYVTGKAMSAAAESNKMRAYGTHRLRRSKHGSDDTGVDLVARPPPEFASWRRSSLSAADRENTWEDFDPSIERTYNRKMEAKVLGHVKKPHALDERKIPGLDIYNDMQGKHHLRPRRYRHLDDHKDYYTDLYSPRAAMARQDDTSEGAAPDYVLGRGTKSGKVRSRKELEGDRYEHPHTPYKFFEQQSGVRRPTRTRPRRDTLAKPWPQEPTYEEQEEQQEQEVEWVEDTPIQELLTANPSEELWPCETWVRKVPKGRSGVDFHQNLDFQELFFPVTDPWIAHALDIYVDHKEAVELKKTQEKARADEGTPAVVVATRDFLRPLGDTVKFFSMVLRSIMTVITNMTRGRGGGFNPSMGTGLFSNEFIDAMHRISVNNSPNELLDGDPSQHVFLPTDSLKLMFRIRDKFPQHSVFFGDFSKLPGTLPGVNGPLVQKRALRYGKDHGNTYLVPVGSADIFFPTDFSLLQSMYQRVTGKGSSTVWTLDAFSRQYCHDFDGTVMKSGYSPLEFDFHNTNIFTACTDPLVGVLASEYQPYPCYEDRRKHTRKSFVERFLAQMTGRVDPDIFRYVRGAKNEDSTSSASDGEEPSSASKEGEDGPLDADMTSQQYSTEMSIGIHSEAFMRQVMGREVRCDLRKPLNNEVQ